jgi:hypothetical protein
MKGFRFPAALLLFSGIALLVAFHPFGRVSAQVNPAAPIQKWEYKVAHQGHETEFNVLGSQGWELCTAVGQYPGNTMPVTFVFKRPVR